MSDGGLTKVHVPEYLLIDKLISTKNAKVLRPFPFWTLLVWFGETI